MREMRGIMGPVAMEPLTSPEMVANPLLMTKSNLKIPMMLKKGAQMGIVTTHLQLEKTLELKIREMMIPT